MIWIDLIYNLALLVSLSVISGFVNTRWGKTLRGALLQGVVFGGAAAIGMLRSAVLAPGLIFDGRSVMISLGGAFFGSLTAAVACAITAPLDQTARNKLLAALQANQESEERLFTLSIPAHR